MFIVCYGICVRKIYINKITGDYPNTSEHTMGMHLDTCIHVTKKVNHIDLVSQRYFKYVKKSYI